MHNVHSNVYREELTAEIKLLRNKRLAQEGLLSKLETSRTQLRERAEAISERYEDTKDRGSDLAHRVEAVLAKVQTRLPSASDAELKMGRDLKQLGLKMAQVEAAAQIIKEKEKYQRHQVTG